MLYKNLSDEELNKVMRIRTCLDYVAAFTFLLKGQLDNARAVMCARKEYKQICPSFSSSRKENLRKTSLNPIPERIKSSILWQFYVGGCKRFSQLSDLKDNKMEPKVRRGIGLVAHDAMKKTSSNGCCGTRNC